MMRLRGDLASSNKTHKQNSQTKLTMTDEQIERSIELIKEMLAQREAGEMAKVIE
jgi:hypothetical protein